MGMGAFSVLYCRLKVTNRSAPYHFLNKNIVWADERAQLILQAFRKKIMSFEKLGLIAELLRAVSEKGYTKPTPIQAQSIPPILAGHDLMGAAQTGTGKTAGFTLPLLQRLSVNRQTDDKTHRRIIRALILVPTRELAAQVQDSIKLYGKHLPFKSGLVFGGVKAGPQIEKMRQGVDILVATPGRLLDLVNQNAIKLSSVEILVLDEADRMLDMGFIHDIRRVLALVPKKRQTLLFSATFSKEIKLLANQFLQKPVLIEVAAPNSTAERIEQTVYPVDRHRKRELLSFMIGSKNWKQVLVFVRTKHGANKLAAQLAEDGLTSAAIHGNKTQAARTRALSDFKQGKVRVLVATDVAARGLDIEKLPHVINFELPNVPEDYVHRIGRTGRAEQEGEAISLVCVDEFGLLKDIEKLLKQRIAQVVISGYEPDLSIKPEPIRKKQAARPQQRNTGASPERKRFGAAGAHPKTNAGGGRKNVVFKGQERRRTGSSQRG